MNTMRNGIIAAVGFALLVLPSASFAGFRPSGALQSACRGDAFRLHRNRRARQRRGPEPRNRLAT
jgi:hypothetical protein